MSEYKRMYKNLNEKVFLTSEYWQFNVFFLNNEAVKTIKLQ